MNLDLLVSARRTRRARVLLWLLRWLCGARVESARPVLEGARRDRARLSALAAEVVIARQDARRARALADSLAGRTEQSLRASLRKGKGTA